MPLGLDGRARRRLHLVSTNTRIAMKLVWGLVMVAVGAFGLLTGLGEDAPAWRMALRVGLVVIGLITVAGAYTLWRHSGEAEE